MCIDTKRKTNVDKVMKAYTDLNQSKKLAEILPLESADMYWKNGISDKYIQCFTPFVSDDDRSNVDFEYDVPCWSLAALLDIYPMVVGRDMDMYCCWQNSKNLHSRHYDNPIDACYEMIIKLNELNLL